MNTPRQIKVAWLSRHAMTQEQIDSLETIIGHNYVIETINHVWQATTDADKDYGVNLTTWNMFLVDFDVIVGVFPPVAYATMPLPWDAGTGCILTPISAPAPELRKSPDAPIPFKHLRWQLLAGHTSKSRKEG